MRYYRQSNNQAIAEHVAASVYDFELQESERGGGRCAEGLAESRPGIRRKRQP
jgi:hypothetical protein